MTAVEIQSGIRENTVGLVERFLEIASVDPVSAAMLATGAILVAVSMAVFGVLSLGAVLATIKRAFPSPPEPRQPAR